MTSEQMYAIHECGHVVVCYCVGGRILPGADSLSIVPNPAQFQNGNARFVTLFSDKKAIVNFAGGLAERIADPNGEVTTAMRGDIDGILWGCAEYREQVKGDSFVDAAQAYYDDRGWIELGQPPQEKEVWEAHVKMIRFLVNGSPEPDRNDDFKLLSDFAQTARFHLQRHWSTVMELADMLVKKKMMSGEEVYQILTTQYGFVCELSSLSQESQIAAKSVAAEPKRGRGRPPKGQRAMTDAERKAAQRMRDARRAALEGFTREQAAEMGDLPTEKILEIKAVMRPRLGRRKRIS